MNVTDSSDWYPGSTLTYFTQHSGAKSFGLIFSFVFNERVQMTRMITFLLPVSSKSKLAGVQAIEMTDQQPFSFSSHGQHAAAKNGLKVCLSA